MSKLIIAISLVVMYAVYSLMIYTKGTDVENLSFSKKEQETITSGKRLYQEYNCQSCHQLYGLGGYLGPELTTAYSDKHRGEAYMKAMLESGGNRMPDFNLSKKQIDQLIAYLKYVDSTATPIKTASNQ